MYFHLLAKILQKISKIILTYGQYYVIVLETLRIHDREMIGVDQYLIGIDVGTTGTKSMLFSDSGRIISHAYTDYPSQMPGTGRVEQNAEDWWHAVVRTVRAITADPQTAKNVVAISLSLQGGTFVPVDRQLRPLQPAIVWSDKRCERQRQDFAQALGQDYIYQKTGWHLGSGLNMLQIAWFRENRPDLFEKTSLFLSVPDYISLRMTGRPVVDISDAGINQLADIRTGRYDASILDYLGITADRLPEIVPSGTPVGRLLKSAAEELGLPRSVLLVAGAHDQYAALLGAGITQTGDIMIGTGTAWVVTALTDEPYFESGFNQSIPASGKWGSLISLSTGGVCLDWFKNSVAGSSTAGMSYAEINELASQRLAGVGGLRFYPYFTGTSFPLKGQHCKATFVGLDLSHDRVDIARAVMEGVAMQTVWTLDFFRERFPLKVVKLSGGAGKAPLWVRMVSNIADCPISVPLVNDLTCVGAGILAGVGAGLFASCEEGAGRFRVDQTLYEPDPAQVERYAEVFEDFKRRALRLPDLYNPVRD